MTPAVPEVDIKSDTATVKGNEVTIKLEYYENPKSPIKITLTSFNPVKASFSVLLSIVGFLSSVL